MKLIFAADAIFPPLTGIGRYAWELARRLEQDSRIEDIRLFSMGRWTPSLEIQAGVGTHGTSKPNIMSSVALHLRKRLSKKVWAIYGYNSIAYRLMQFKLRPFANYLYHSPNFFVPPFKGKSVATIHDLSVYKFPETHPKSRRRIFDLCMARTLRQASHLITDSEATRSEVIEYFNWPEDRITAIHLGVDPTFRPRVEQQLTSRLSTYNLTAGHYSLCVSTLEPRKRINSLLEAYGRLPPALRELYPLVFVGDSGWLNDAIHEKLLEGRHAGWVHSLGFVPSVDLPILYAGARAMCYPSIYEGFGLPVLESMASGVPVLTSDRSSLPEVANGAAWLTDPDDIDAMTIGLYRVLEDAEWRARAIDRGLDVAAKKTWDRCATRTIEVYERILSE